MNEQKRMTRKKLLTRALIIAACLMVIAAVTVTCVFAANDWGRNFSTVDKDDNTQIQNPDDDKDDDDHTGGDDQTGGDNDDQSDDDTPTATETTFALPVSDIDIVTGYVFCKDVTLGHYHFHSGLDLAADAGTEVVSCLDGTVESIVVGDRLNGTTVTISHDNGLKTVYSFIDAAEGLEAGQSVERGEVIGTIAEANGAEMALGPHLHFAVYDDGELANPEDYLEIAKK